MNWTNVKDELPLDEKSVLLYTKDETYAVGWLEMWNNELEWWYYNHNASSLVSSNFITHWAKLTPPDDTKQLLGLESLEKLSKFPT